MNTGVDVFETTLQKTVLWLDELMSELGWQDRHRAYAALRAVLHTLRDRLTADEAVDLAAQLPMLVRGFYFEGWHPAGTPLKYRHKADFFERMVREMPGLAPDEAERVADAVFKVLSDHVTAGAQEHVKHQLPAEVRALWP